MIRFFTLDYTSAPASIGFEAQSPIRDGCCIVTFDDIHFTHERLYETAGRLVAQAPASAVAQNVRSAAKRQHPRVRRDSGGRLSPVRRGNPRAVAGT